MDLGLGLIVVADGMGGHNAGEVASRMAVDVVIDFVRSTRGGGEITWPFPIDPSHSLAMNRVEIALRLANQRVHSAGERDPGRSGMGTTIVTALVEDDHIVIGHAGDSRAYVWRQGHLQQITQDHTWLNAIGESELHTSNHPLRHVLTNGIGMGDELTPTVIEESLAAGDRWLICSDGVHGYVDLETLTQAMQLTSPEAAAQEVVRCALAAGTTDNATAVVLNVL